VRPFGWFLVVIAGCAAPHPAALPPPAASPPPAAAPVAMPTPAQARLDAAVAENAACEACHREIAAEWRGSLHHRADVEPSYLRAFAIEPMPFCRGCHAPEAVAAEPEGADVAALGVGCVTCHVTGPGGTLAAPAAPAAPPAAPSAPAAAPSAPAPHAVVRDARFAGAAACSACHEFAFPAARGRTAAELMQSTVTEHAASPAAGEACAGCHMPRTRSGRRSHAFLASRDPATLRRALEVRAARTSATTVRLTLLPQHPGHALPTGDLFRRLELSAEAAGPDRISLGSAVRYLARHWEPRPRGGGRVLVRDDRPRQDPVSIDLDVGAPAAGRDIVWRVAYQRVAHPNGIDARDAEIDGEITLAEGKLPP
jgi:hypothetical protein